jgi:hypothetical protein
MWLGHTFVHSMGIAWQNLDANQVVGAHEMVQAALDGRPGQPAKRVLGTTCAMVASVLAAWLGLLDIGWGLCSRVLAHHKHPCTLCQLTFFYTGQAQ